MEQHALQEDRLRNIKIGIEKLTAVAGHQPELLKALRELEQDFDRRRRRRAAQEILAPRA